MTTPENAPRVRLVEWVLWGRTARLAIVGSVAGAFAVCLLLATQPEIGPGIITVGPPVAILIAVPYGLIIAIGSTIGGTIGKRKSAIAELVLTALGGAVAVAACILWACIVGWVWSWPFIPPWLGAIGALATLAFVQLTRRYRRRASPRARES